MPPLYRSMSADWSLPSMVMVMPAIGDPAVPPRLRLSFAVVMAILMAPLVGQNITSVPASVSDMIFATLRESLLGLMIGGILRLFFNTLATVGEIISLQTTLSFAQTANPTEAQPSPSLGAFLGMLGAVLIMTTDLHHMFLSAIVSSYRLFPFGPTLPVQDSAQLALQTVASSFALGIQLSGPVIAFSLVFNIATGLVARAMPQFQVFFAATPLALLLGLSVFTLSLGTLTMVWIDRYRLLLGQFE